MNLISQAALEEDKNRSHGVDRPGESSKTPAAWKRAFGNKA